METCGECGAQYEKPLGVCVGKNLYMSVPASPFDGLCFDCQKQAVRWAAKQAHGDQAARRYFVRTNSEAGMPMHWRQSGAPVAACGLKLVDSGCQFTYGAMKVTCEACMEVYAKVVSEKIGKIKFASIAGNLDLLAGIKAPPIEQEPPADNPFYK